MPSSPKLSLWRYLNAFLPPLIWALVIFIFSSQSALPKLELSTADFIFKKFAHMFVYAVLYILLYRGVQVAWPSTSPTLKWSLPILLCLIYAFSDEYHQSLVPGRYPTSRDVGYDMLGVGIAFLRKYQYI